MDLTRFALTGGIACGKTAVARLFEEHGWNVLDADSVVHSLESADGMLVESIRLLAGDCVLAPDGGIDRSKLAEVVFADPGMLRRLEELVHPCVKARFDDWFAESQGPHLAVIPLLYEVGWADSFDRVICITAPEELQIERMMQLRRMTREQALSRLRAQMPTSEKAAKADFVIVNDGTLEELKEKVQGLIERLATH